MTNTDFELLRQMQRLLADCQALLAEYKPDDWEGFPDDSYRAEYERVQTELELVLSIQGKK